MDLKISELVFLLEKKNQSLIDSENELREKSEELEAQKEELTAAVEELIDKNKVLNTTLDTLKERNLELDQLVYRTSHDLKTPITSTLGIISLIEAQPGANNIQNYLEYIKTSMEQMKNLLFSISLFTEVSQHKIDLQHINLSELIKNTLKLVTNTIQFDKVSFDLKLNGTIYIQSDVNLMQELLKNIIANALVFSDPNKPKITISTIQVGKNIEINITDNGDGIDPKVLPFVFDIFYRGSNKSKGSGLGLYVSKKIITLLKGSIKLHSTTDGLSVVIVHPMD